LSKVSQLSSRHVKKHRNMGQIEKILTKTMTILKYCQKFLN